MVMANGQSALSVPLGSSSAACIRAQRAFRRQLVAGAPLFQVAAIALLAATYFATARLGLRFGVVGGIAAPVWPPPGICLAALLLCGYRVWPGVALGAFATNASIGVPLGGAFAIAAANTAAAVAGAWILRRLGFSVAVARLRDVLALVVLAALISTFGATAAALCMDGRADGSFASIWRAWWTGDAMSILLLTPLLCCWAQPPARRAGPRRTLEAALLIAVQPVINALVFFGVLPLTPLARLYVLYPVLIWTAVRFGPRGITASLLLTAVIAIGATAGGHGPFAGATPTTNLLSLHTFIGIAAVTFLTLAASVAERRAALARIAAGLEAIVRSSSDAIVSTSMTGIITSWNAAAEHTYGYSAAEAIGQPISLIVPPARLPALCDSYGQLGRHERIRDGDTFQLTKRGDQIAVSVTLSPIEDEAGRILGVSFVARDIRERRRADEERERLLAELERAVHVRDDFLSVASHELRTPVTALGLKLERLAYATTPAARQQMLEATARIVRKLGRMIDDLLDVTRVRAGQLALELDDVDLSGVVEEVAARLREQATRAGSNLELALPGAVVGRWDRARLEQVAENLISNAIKYGDGHAIGVAVQATEQTARLVVSDHGIGNAPADRARIFERFGRAASSRSYSGLGLGLWITGEIVHACGGQIRVDGAVGVGSSFTVELPRKPTDGRTML
jgi:PAS domain S-box-containing protein